MRIKDLMALTTSLIVSSLPIAYPSMAFTLRPTKPIITTFWADKPNAKTTRDNPFKLRISGLDITVDITITNLKAKDSAAQKALKIRNAIKKQTPAFIVSNLQNQIIIENADKIKIVNDPTKERLGKINQNIEYKALFQSADVASGLDTFGNASLVQIGIENLYVAQVVPQAGGSFADIFQELEELLDSHNIDATFDEHTGTLKLDKLLRPEQTLVFGNTDTSLNTSSSVKTVKQMEVPEPSSNFSLLILGILGLGVIFKIQK